MRKFSLCILLLVGCATVETRTNLVQRTGEVLRAGVGDTVVRINSWKNLPNVFGRSDLFGRMTPTGFTTLVFLGLSGGKLSFARHDVDIETGATTMNSTPIVLPNTTVTNYSGSYAGHSYYGSSVTSGPPVVIPASAPKASVIQRPQTTFELEVSSLPQSIVVQGYSVEVLSADQSMLTYMVSK